MFSVEKPKYRGQLRRILGKEYFCLKERWKWQFSGEHFASEKTEKKLPFELISHQSVLLRKLKDVDMKLQYNKITNLRLAAAKLNGILIKPGETFSVWKLVGRPSRSKGYLPGMTLHNGQVGSGTGGGLCQLGNLLYWMALHSPLTVTKRWRHSYDVFPDSNRTLPFGSGATLSYNYIDLQLRNDTDQTFQIEVWLSEKNLHGSILSNQQSDWHYQVFERAHRFELQWWGGYTRHNEIWRKIQTHSGEVIGEELVTENHAVMMYNPLLTGSSNS
ncbi:MAG: VanW family protein [Bacteroidetes bacterium]|nr:VanW family protein [Bacteroidota bacterium]